MLWVVYNNLVQLASAIGRGWNTGVPKGNRVFLIRGQFPPTFTGNGGADRIQQRE